MMYDVHVQIVGAGLVGLSTALALDRAGVTCAVIEKHPGTALVPKARRFTFRTMEVFRALGVAEAVYEAAEGLAAYQGMRAGRTLADADPLPPPPHVDYSMLALTPETSCLVAQDLLEPVLLSAVRARGIPVDFDTRLTDLSQDSDGVTARVEGRTIRSAYVVGADGSRSTVRDLVGISTSGRGALRDAVTVYFEADLADLVAGREFNLCQVEHPTAPGAFASVDGRYRWVFMAAPLAPVDDHPQWTELLRAALGAPDVDIKILAVQTWQPTMRVADRLVSGRVVLAGDAAHTMPPFAAAGANTGIQDAPNLAWKLGARLAGMAGPDLLETYHAERHAAGWHAAEQSTLRINDLRTNDLRTKDLRADPGPHLDDPLALVAGYQYGSGALVPDGSDPQPRDRLELTGRPGTRMPHLVTPSGQSTMDLVTDGLTLLAGPDASGWRDAARSLDLPVADAGPGWPRAAGIAADGALLVRPDHIVAWRQHGAADDPQWTLNTTVGTILGWPAAKPQPAPQGDLSGTDR